MVKKRSSAQQLREHAEASKKARMMMFRLVGSHPSASADTQGCPPLADRPALASPEAEPSASADTQGCPPSADRPALASPEAEPVASVPELNADPLSGDSSNISSAAMESVAKDEGTAAESGVVLRVDEDPGTVDLECGLEMVLMQGVEADKSDTAMVEMWESCMDELPIGTATASAARPHPPHLDETLSC